MSYLINSVNFINLYYIKFPGIVWFRWRGWDYSLKRSRMMIRPKNFAAEEKEKEKEKEVEN